MAGPTKIDAFTVLRNIYNPNTNRIGTDTVASIPSGSFNFDIDQSTDSVLTYGKDPSGTNQPIRTSELGSSNVDGLYDNTDNTDPANIGLVLLQRNVSSSDSIQTERPTAKRGTTDTATVAIDVSMHDGDGNAISASNPIPTTLTVPDNEELITIFDEITSVPSATGIAIVTYTVPAFTTFYLNKIEFGGTNIAKFELYIDNILFDRKRTYFGSNLFANFSFDEFSSKGLKLNASQVVTIQVEHNRTMLGDFESRIQGLMVS